MILQTKHRQAEHFNDTGRIAGSTSTGDPGVVVETTSDAAGGTQNIGFIEPGDWISFDRVNLKDITRSPCGWPAPTGADFEIRWNDPATGPLLGTVPAKPTTGWQVFDNTQTALTSATDETGTLYLVAKKDGQTGSRGQRQLGRLHRQGRDRQPAAGHHVRLGDPADREAPLTSTWPRRPRTPRAATSPTRGTWAPTRTRRSPGPPVPSPT